MLRIISVPVGMSYQREWEHIPTELDAHKESFMRDMDGKMRELDALLADGWTVIASGVIVADGGFVMGMILHKPD